jgi:hypothetical protein
MTRGDLLQIIDSFILENNYIPEYPRWAIEYWDKDENLVNYHYYLIDGTKETGYAVFKKCWEIVKDIDETYLEYESILLVKENSDYDRVVLEVWNIDRDRYKIE